MANRILAYNRECAAKYYRTAARLGDTGDAYGNKAVADAQDNLRSLAANDEERLTMNLASLAVAPDKRDPLKTGQARLTNLSQSQTVVRP